MTLSIRALRAGDNRISVLSFFRRLGARYLYQQCATGTLRRYLRMLSGAKTPERPTSGRSVF